MTMMDAPEYDPTHDNRMKALLIGSVVLVLVVFFGGMAGLVTGHGFFFTNLPQEHKVNKFFNALEAKDYNTAYGLYVNDANWQQHPEKFGYKLNRAIEDWTIYTPVKGPITSHHVDVSKVDGHGMWGTGVTVGVRINGDTKTFLYVDRADGTISWPSPHELQY
jgi:hypothetical protein